MYFLLTFKLTNDLNCSCKPKLAHLKQQSYAIGKLIKQSILCTKTLVRRQRDHIKKVSLIFDLVKLGYNEHPVITNKVNSIG